MAATAPPASATRRRRWPRILLGAAAACALLLLLAVGSVAWYFSGKIGDAAVIPQPDAGYPMTITSVADGRIAYTGVPSGWDDIGLAALATAEGGYVQTGDPQITGEGAGSRAVLAAVSGPALAAGQHARLDGWYFGADPHAALGLDYEQVSIPTALGPEPAWLVPGSGSTWVVYLHGRGDAPAQGLRMTKVFAEQGYPVLLTSYRNDPGAPAGNGYGQFGVTEWSDAESAIQYALDSGAERVVLAGTSMGGAMALGVMEHSTLAPAVAGLFLDAPAIDFGTTVDTAAPSALPGVLVGLAKQVASWRFGFDWSGMDHRAVAARLTVPVEIVQGLDDTSVPPALTRAFAAAAPERITVVEIPGAGHTTGWNVDPQAYEQAIRDLLASTGASGA